ncbi:MAG TPA: hypothetical protein DDX29_03645, partial [Clostridiales bacterium]|nr:hypothetical protein [Clostridiales bacterium]
MKKKLILLICMFLFLSFISAYANTGGVEGLTTVKGKVVEIVTHLKPDDLNAGEGSLIQEQQIVKVRVMSGDFQGREYLVENNMGSNQVRW